MPSRIYVIKRFGALSNVGRGMPAYELDTVRKVLNNLTDSETLPYDVHRVRIPHLGSATRADSCIWKYDSNEVEFHVARSDKARETFVQCLRITQGHLDGTTVLAVYGAEFHRSYKLFSSVGEAFAGDDIPVDLQFLPTP
jgi:hypothetical protein